MIRDQIKDEEDIKIISLEEVFRTDNQTLIDKMTEDKMTIL